ncbi:MAG: hypothetical protein ACT4P6_09700 [Gemmatimonadaceae bacterium]
MRRNAARVPTLIMSCFAAIASSVQAQTIQGGTIRGGVLDQSGAPVVGALVTLPDTRRSTYSGSDKPRLPSLGMRWTSRAMD